MSGTRKTNKKTQLEKDKLGSELTLPICSDINDASRNNNTRSTEYTELTATEKESAERMECE